MALGLAVMAIALGLRLQSRARLQIRAAETIVLAAPEHPVSQTGDLWLLGATVTCPKCRKTSPLERAIKR
jgi:hypothetical protein